MMMGKIIKRTIKKIVLMMEKIIRRTIKKIMMMKRMMIVLEKMNKQKMMIKIP